MWGRLLVSGASVAGVLALSGEAHAEGRTRDGFYLSMDAGIGYLSSNAAGEPSWRDGLESVSSLSPALGFWAGGTVGRTVIGGGFFANYLVVPGTWGAFLLTPGMFLDIHPSRQSKLHIVPFLGWGWLAPWLFGPMGPVASVGVGYDFWEPSESWSLGMMGRLAYGPLFQHEGTYHTFAPSLLFTATYH